MKKDSIAIDMDGVMADVEAHFLSWFNKEYLTSLTHEDLKDLQSLQQKGVQS